MATAFSHSTDISKQTTLCCINIHLSGEIGKARFKSGLVKRDTYCSQMQVFVEKDMIRNIGILIKLNKVV